MSVFVPSDILLPRVEDPTAWSVIACDQFTSQREYWEAAERRVGRAPSALRLILPEAWLGTDRAAGADERIARTMEQYLNDDLFERHTDCFIYLERKQSDGRIRRGLVGALDLEQYDFTPGNRAAVRATEATVEDRLPPRVVIRSAAALELPHVMVLMDDREDAVLGTLEKAVRSSAPLYDFDLMLGGGHVTGWKISGDLLQNTLTALNALGDSDRQHALYGEAGAVAPMPFAVGDGNHSLAAAKRWWEQLRETLTPEKREAHPARYALAELCNIQEPALDFEPIHRVIFDTDASDFSSALAARRQEWEDPNRTIGERVAAADAFCADYIAAHGGRLDYIHGTETAREMGDRPGCGAVLLPPVEKNGLFLSVIKNGALPRKSFSMGHAEDKRYYLECRRIR